MNIVLSRKNAVLGFLYVLTACVTIFGEYTKDEIVLQFSKPFLIPIIGMMYFSAVKKINRIYILALVFVWLANLFFIFQTEEFIFKGAISYLVSWLIITFLILIKTSFPDKISFGIAIIPFAFVYCCVLQLIHPSIQDSIYLFFLNGVVMTFLGAYSLASYFNNSSKSNTYLLISILLFTFIQFLVSIDLYYISVKLFRPLAMLMYACGQFFLMKTLVSYEHKKI